MSSSVLIPPQWEVRASGTAYTPYTLYALCTLYCTLYTLPQTTLMDCLKPKQLVAVPCRCQLLASCGSMSEMGATAGADSKSRGGGTGSASATSSQVLRTFRKHILGGQRISCALQNHYNYAFMIFYDLL